jgi:hypothetical protein
MRISNDPGPAQTTQGTRASDYASRSMAVNRRQLTEGADGQMLLQHWRRQSL